MSKQVIKIPLHSRNCFSTSVWAWMSKKRLQQLQLLLHGVPPPTSSPQQSKIYANLDEKESKAKGGEGNIAPKVLCCPANSAKSEMNVRKWMSLTFGNVLINPGSDMLTYENMNPNTMSYLRYFAR